MNGAIIAQWVATIVIAIGLLATWMHNNRNQSERWGGMEKEIENIKEKLEDPNSGLGAIKKAVDDQKTHCVSVTTGFEHRIKTLEKENKE